MIKKLIPSSFRLNLRLGQRSLRDLFSGYSSRFAGSSNEAVNFSHSVHLSQPIKQSKHFENKVHNIKEGIKRVEEVVIFPGEIFSFWNTVKRPDKKNNFRVGRNLISGSVSEDFGGGLCQLSSIIYHLSLIGGLKIIERHNHSIDIYKEHERFTPLGADSAVVFGYKDLRVRNDNSFPVRFSLEVKEDMLYCTLSGAGQLEEREIIFEKAIQNTQATISTKARSGKGEEVIALSVYKIPME